MTTENLADATKDATGAQGTAVAAENQRLYLAANHKFERLVQQVKGDDS